MLRFVVQLSLRRFAAILGLTVVLLSACGGSDEVPVASAPLPPPAPSPEWFVPDCDQITGIPVATFSRDGGKTFVPFAEEVMVDSRTSKLVAVPEHGGLLFAIHNRFETGTNYSSAVYYSTDAGCHWEKYAELPGDGFRELTALGTWGFAGNETDGRLYRLHADGSREDIGYATGDSMTATPDDPSGLYSLVNDHIWRGSRFGRSWGPQGTEIPTPSVSASFAINPVDQLHMIVTGHGGEAAVTFDGGNSWMTSTGVVGDADIGQTRFAVFGGDDATEDLWVLIRRWYEQEDGSSMLEEHLARSIDGGLGFEDAVRMDHLDVLAMAAVPQQAGEVLIASDDCEVTTPCLYRYRSSDNTLARINEHHEGRGSFSTLVFHPTNPDVLYAGISLSGPVSK